MIAGWIGAAYWFTSSTSFANPAITIARSLTDTFSGIRLLDVPAFVCAQLAGAVAGAVVGRLTFDERRPVSASDSPVATPHQRNQPSR